MAEEIEYWEFDAAEDLIDAVVGDISFIIESALDARGQALVAFPGGSTPKPTQSITNVRREASPRLAPRQEWGLNVYTRSPVKTSRAAMYRLDECFPET